MIICRTIATACRRSRSKRFNESRQKYVKPDEAALIVVGDGASVLEQIKPYCEDIETLQHCREAKNCQQAQPADGSGWFLVDRGGNTARTKYSCDAHYCTRQTRDLPAVIHSEMGDADLGAIEINDNSFHAHTSLEMDGHAVEAEVSAQI